MKKSSRLALISIVVGVLACSGHGVTISQIITSPPFVEADRANAGLLYAFTYHQSHLPISGHGTVSRILPDDNTGDRHQKFIVRYAPGHTLLIDHNIDLAPRIDTLQLGEEIRFSGEYVWNKKGGLLHRTHHDPYGVNKGGWLQYRGQKYQ